MKVKIDKSRKVYKGSLYSGRINENEYEVLEFEFPQELENFTKYIEIEATDNEGTLRYADRIEDNSFAIDNTLSKYSLITAQVVCKDLRENVVFKSNPFEFTFEQSLNIMEDIEEEQQDLLDRIELELQEAKEDITDLQETQEQHTEQIQTNATYIEDLQERVTTNETDIANIKTKNTQQDTAIATNTQDISNIKEEQTTQNTNITSNTNRITVLEAQSGNKVALSINSNYVMTLQLLNKNNEVLSTGTIDLPIESMVVNASYSNGILTLTLQNGQTLNVDISDIVSGLVSETTFNTAISELQSSITALQGRMTTAENNIANKVDKVTGKGLSTNDYTTAEKNKLANLENYDDTEVKAEIQQNATDIVALEEKHDAEVAELNEKITDLQEELDMTADLIPTDEATGSDITINDSARYYFKKFEVGGNSEQDTTKLTYICDGTETGTYYFTYDSINYQFTMPTIQEGSILVFNRSTLVLSLDNTAIATETGTSGTQLTFVASPNPDYPQDIKNIGNNINIFNKDTMLLNTYIKVVSGEQISNEGYNTTDYIPVKTNIKYCINKMFVGNSGSAGICYYDENKSFLFGESWNNLGYTTNLERENILFSAIYQSIKYVKISIRTQTNFDTLKIEKGTVATGYSPYNCGSTDVKVENKNLFNDILELGIINSNGDNTYNTAQSRNKNYILLKPNTQYTISTSIQCNIGLRFYDKDKIYLSNMTGTASPKTFTMPENAYYLRIVLTANDLTNKVQIEKGSTATSYIEHEEQTETFPLAEGQVLHLGDTLEDDGVHQRRKTIVLDGSENWQLYGDDIFYIPISDYTTTILPLCTHFLGVEAPVNAGAMQSRPNNSCALAANSTNRRLYIKTNEFTTVEDFKAFLVSQKNNNTPMLLEYMLRQEQEIIVPYTEIQQEAYDEIKKIYSYKGTTYISSDNEPSPIFNVIYRKDYTGITDARLDALEARVALLEG